MDINCIVDVASREVSFQENYRIAAYDHNVDVIRFSIEPIEDFSLDTSSIRIAAQGPNKARHDYAVDPSTVAIEEETGYITFDWPIPAGVTEMPIGTFKYGDKGQLIFAVCAEIISGSTVSKAWHSDDGIITVVAHLEPEAGGGEDPEEEATNAQKIAQLQTDVAVINTQVGALANGSPTPVETIAEMTDESAVYLYTGSETGYTAGNWYFWNGSAWTSGGTYGGAVTSTTFNQHSVPADDFAVGQALAEKADSSDVTALETAVAEKADADDVGDLSQLTTTAKDSLVSAINEANEAVTEIDGRSNDEIADLKSALKDSTVFYNDELGIEFIPVNGSASSSSTPYEEIRILDLPLIAGKTYQINWSIPAEISPYVVYCFLSDGHGNNLVLSRITAGDTIKINTYTAAANNNDSYLYFTVGNVQVTVSASVTMTNADPTRIDDLETSVDALEDTTVKKVESRNIEITDPDTGHYINKNGGYSASNPFSISQAFNVYAGETIEVVATGYLNQTAIIAQAKSEYPYTVLALSRSSAEETYTYTALEDMSVVVSYDNRKPCIIVVKKIYDLDALLQIQEEMRNVKWKYAFDRICCIGDSLTSGAYYAGSWGGASIAQNYPNILSRMLNTTVKNSGRSGASAKTWYINNMAGLTLSDYGTFVVWLGTNQGLTDTISTDVDPYDDYNDFADTNTGYLCRTICQIKEAVPDAHIMICTVFSTSGDLATTNDVINQVASKYALQLVDSSDLDNTNYPLYHSNAVHFNKAGNIFVADRIKNAMISYVAPNGRSAEFGLTARTD